MTHPYRSKPEGWEPEPYVTPATQGIFAQLEALLFPSPPSAIAMGLDARREFWRACRSMGAVHYTPLREATFCGIPLVRRADVTGHDIMRIE